MRKYINSGGISFTFGKYVICYVHLQRASLVCDSNPVVASQTRFAVYRMKRRICANLNLTYSQSMELGLSPDMFFKWIGGVFPTEIRSCFRVLCMRSSRVYATGVSCPLQRSDEFVPG